MLHAGSSVRHGGLAPAPRFHHHATPPRNVSARFDLNNADLQLIGGFAGSLLLGYVTFTAVSYMEVKDKIDAAILRGEDPYALRTEEDENNSDRSPQTKKKKKKKVGKGSQQKKKRKGGGGGGSGIPGWR